MSSRMLKKSASGVLASFRDSEALEGIFRSPRSILWANGYTKCGRYLLATSLAAALLDGHFEHPARVVLLYQQNQSVLCVPSKNGEVFSIDTLPL